jgi:hypothetical protein
MDTPAMPKLNEDIKQEKWAVLIGVACYMEGEARLVSYRDLNGPVIDVELIEHHLVHDLGVDKSHIFKLTATSPGCSQKPHKPTEQQEYWPTYENMIRVFDTVTEKAKEHDIVYIHYSGHGARVTTLFPTEKGHRGVDEALVPTDINCGGRYLRDVEIAVLFDRMVKKMLYVTAVFDSCHSGGATKNGAEEMVARGIGLLDVTQLPSDTSDLPQEEINSASATEALRPSQDQESFWLEPQGYVLIAACLPTQTAWETGLGHSVHGLLTYWLVDCLKIAAREGTLSKLTHDMLHRSVLAKIRDWGKRRNPVVDQMPVLLGGSRRIFFGTGISEDVHTVDITEVLQTEVRLRAGRAQGVCRNDLYEIYSWDAGKLTQLGHPLAKVSVTQVFELESMAKFEEGPVQGQVITSGYQAVLVQRHIDMGTDIKLQYPTNADAAQRTRLELVESILDPTKIASQKYISSINPLRLAKNGRDSESVLFHITVDELSRYKLLDQTCNTIPYLPVYEDPDSILAVATQLGRFQRYLDLKNPDKSDEEFSFRLIPQGEFSNIYLVLPLIPIS